jgi:hypothetical protein
MKGVLALLLIAGGLYIVYEVLAGGSSLLTGGSTTPTAAGNAPIKINTLTPAQAGTFSGNYRAPGGAISQKGPVIPPPIIGPGERPKDPTTGQPVGGGMVSLQTRLSHLGTILAIDPFDHYIKRGWN